VQLAIIERWDLVDMRGDHAQMLLDARGIRRQRIAVHGHRRACGDHFGHAADGLAGDGIREGRRGLRRRTVGVSAEAQQECGVAEWQHDGTYAHCANGAMV
jgi:hypothetical protein